MTTSTKKPRPKTYLPTDVNETDLQNFIRLTEHFANKQTRLISSDDEEVLLPEQFFDVLRRVADALASGRGVTVMPQETKLTTQQAADMLGISRPTLVKLLETGEIPFEKVGRHRRVTLRDLTTYRDRARTERRAVLRQMARDGQEAGLHTLDPQDRPVRK